MYQGTLCHERALYFNSTFFFLVWKEGKVITEYLCSVSILRLDNTQRKALPHFLFRQIEREKTTFKKKMSTNMDCSK